MGKIEKALTRGFSCLLTMWLQMSLTLKNVLYILNASGFFFSYGKGNELFKLMKPSGCFFSSDSYISLIKYLSTFLGPLYSPC